MKTKTSVKGLLTLSVLGLLIAISACATQRDIPATAVQCEEPRAPICTREYRPVCGVTETGELKTYGNGCSACAEQSVAYYLSGDCGSH